MQLTRAVDSFLSYISDLLTLAYQTQPDMLKNSQPTLSLEDVLEYASKEELIAAEVERQVTDLSYMGFDKLAAYLARVPKFNLFPDPARRKVAVEIVEMRNLIVHNRGIIDRKFVFKVPAYAGQLGQPLPLTVAQVGTYHQQTMRAFPNVQAPVRMCTHGPRAANREMRVTEV